MPHLGYVRGAVAGSSVTRVRTRAALVAAATLTGLLVAPTNAAVVAQTCQGLPATIVATLGDEPTLGTEGDDVIVGLGPVNINALGGNDVICLDAGAVDAGDGDDAVLVTGPKAPEELYATLGAGDDRFVGGPSRDLVDVVNSPGSPGTDTISTGAGNDQVTSGNDPTTSVDPGQPNHDVVDLGTGDDLLRLALPAGSQVQVQGGDSRHDGVHFQGDNADFGFDLGTGAVTRAGVAAASLLGFENFELWLLRFDNFELWTKGALSVRGTSGSETLDIAAARIDLDLGDGRDSVHLMRIGAGPPASSILVRARIL